MWISTQTMISISQVNNDLSNALKIISKYGSVVIMKNNEPVYMGISIEAFEKEDLDDMATISMREASRNFSTLTYKIYDSGYVVLKKRKEPVCVMCSFKCVERCANPSIQYIKDTKEDVNHDSNT